MDSKNGASEQPRLNDQQAVPATLSGSSSDQTQPYQQPIEQPFPRPEQKQTPKTTKKRILIVILVLFVGLPLIGLIIFTIYTGITLTNGDLWGNKAGSYAICNGILAESKESIDKLIENKHVDGKEFNCGGYNADIQRVYRITYTIRGDFDTSQSYMNANQQIAEALKNTGWLAQSTTLNGVIYSFVLANNNKIVADFKVLSPKYSLFELRLSAHSSYQPSSEDRSKPVEIPLPSDELDKYLPFTLYKPLYVPAGYKSWKQEQARETDETVYVNFSLEDKPNTGSIYITESYISPDDKPSACSAEHCQYTQVATHKSGVPIFARNSGQSPTGQFEYFFVAIGETKIALDWPLDRDSKDLSNVEAIQVLDSLQ